MRTSLRGKAHILVLQAAFSCLISAAKRPLPDWMISEFVFSKDNIPVSAIRFTNAPTDPTVCKRIANQGSAFEVPKFQINISIPQSAAFIIHDDVTSASVRLGGKTTGQDTVLTPNTPESSCNCTFHQKSLELLYVCLQARVDLVLTHVASLPQVGTFTTQHGEYFLEPLLRAAGEEYDEEHNKPHLVYRHERHENISIAANSGAPCAASGNSVQTDFTACNHSLSDFLLQTPSLVLS